MKTKNVTEKNMKVCLVGSSGGHLTHLYMLKPFWKDKNRFWVTFDKEDARSLLEGEKVYPCYFPTNRSIKALIKNTKIAWDVLHKEKPDLIISCGAAVAVPFFYIGKMMGAKLVYIEVFDRIDKPTMTGKMVYIEEIKRKAEQDEVVPFRDVFNIVTVGRLTEQKGYDIAVKAANILKKKKIDFAWYAIGGGRDEEKLKKLVEEYHLENQFVFLGRKDNPYPYMKHCDLYVQPSRHEGYVITLVEARALCLPIVSSDIPSAREQIQDASVFIFVEQIM